MSRTIFAAPLSHSNQKDSGTSIKGHLLTLLQPAIIRQLLSVYFRSFRLQTIWVVTADFLCQATFTFLHSLQISLMKRLPILMVEALVIKVSWKRMQRVKKLRATHCIPPYSNIKKWIYIQPIQSWPCPHTTISILATMLRQDLETHIWFVCKSMQKVPHLFHWIHCFPKNHWSVFWFSEDRFTKPQAASTVCLSPSWSAFVARVGKARDKPYRRVQNLSHWLQQPVQWFFVAAEKQLFRVTMKNVF